MKLFSKLTAAHNAKEMTTQFNKKRTMKTNIARGTAGVVSSILGDAHFITQSLADGIVKAEQEIVHKLRGNSKAAIGKFRTDQTISTQEGIKVILADIHSEARRGAKTIITSTGKLRRVDPTVVASTTDITN